MWEWVQFLSELIFFPLHVSHVPPIHQLFYVCLYGFPIRSCVTFKCPLNLERSGSVFTNHSQDHPLSLSPRFAKWNVTKLLIGNQKLCYIQMLLNIEKSGEQDQERS